MFTLSLELCLGGLLPLKQHYVETGILCGLVPPTVSECNTTVLKTNPRSVTKS